MENKAGNQTVNVNNDVLAIVLNQYIDENANLRILVESLRYENKQLQESMSAEEGQTK